MEAVSPCLHACATYPISMLSRPNKYLDTGWKYAIISNYVQCSASSYNKNLDFQIICYRVPGKASASDIIDSQSVRKLLTGIGYLLLAFPSKEWNPANKVLLVPGTQIHWTISDLPQVDIACASLNLLVWFVPQRLGKRYQLVAILMPRFDVGHHRTPNPTKRFANQYWKRLGSRSSRTDGCWHIMWCQHTGCQYWYCSSIQWVAPWRPLTMVETSMIQWSMQAVYCLASGLLNLAHNHCYNLFKPRDLFLNCTTHACACETHWIPNIHRHICSSGQ